MTKLELRSDDNRYPIYGLCLKVLYLKTNYGNAMHEGRLEQFFATNRLTFKNLKPVSQLIYLNFCCGC